MNHRVKRGINYNGRVVTVMASDMPFVYLINGKAVSSAISHLISTTQQRNVRKERHHEVNLRRSSRHLGH